MAEMFDEQMKAVRHRIEETAAEIRELLVDDLRTYPDRELKRRFLAQPERAEGITDKELQQLRSSAAALGDRLAAQVQAALADEKVWFELAGDDAEEVAEGKDLRQIGPVWARLAVVDAELTELASRVDLGQDDRKPSGYAPPRRFIGRRYLPTLVEAYTRAASELQMLLQSSAQERAAEIKRSLSARWSAASQDD
ncbi:MAG TPA: hypothetical protein DCQ06_09910 [Myxococcales bacterium]|nr:hypothetical protein [Myxococcales bacterium]HAN31899.1 hypothetical protein [Myxococcales bacterium]